MEHHSLLHIFCVINARWTQIEFGIMLFLLIFRVSMCFVMYISKNLDLWEQNLIYSWNILHFFWFFSRFFSFNNFFGICFTFILRTLSFYVSTACRSISSLIVSIYKVCIFFAWILRFYVAIYDFNTFSVKKSFFLFFFLIF